MVINSYRGGIWRGFEFFISTIAGHHITDCVIKDLHILGTTLDDLVTRSFSVRDGVLRPLVKDSLAVRATLDAPDIIRWADDVVAAMDVADGFPILPAGRRLYFCW